LVGETGCHHIGEPERHRLTPEGETFTICRHAAYGREIADQGHDGERRQQLRGASREQRLNADRPG
jgi:hypothetical protein